MRSESELRALVVLLGDEHPPVSAAAREVLTSARDAAVPFLEEGTRSGDPMVRGRSRLLLEEMRRGAVEEDWLRFAQMPDQELDLEEGCVLLSRLHGDSNTDAVNGFLDAAAGMVRAHMAAVGGLQALGEVLFDNLGFRGGDFDNVNCHYLSSVLEHRVGIQISLATVYVLVGRRLGLPVTGVAMPSHYLTRFERPDGPIFVDCFNRGRLYRYDTLVELLSSKGMQFSERYLEPATARFTLFRMLNNLERLYLDTDNGPMTAKARRLRAALQVQA